MDDHERGKQEKNILWDNKNQGPEGNNNETWKGKGLDESYQKNEFHRKINWELSEGEWTQNLHKDRRQCVTKKRWFFMDKYQQKTTMTET